MTSTCAHTPIVVFGCPCRRHAAATPRERKAHAAKLVCGESVSLAGDQQAVAWLRAACAAMLQSLPTSIEQDEQWVAQHCGAATAASEATTAGAGTVTEGKDSGSTQAGAAASAEPGCLELAVLWRLGYKR